MLLRIQKNESLRSYVERNLFVLHTSLDSEIFESLSHCDYDNSQVKVIANLLGWHGCYGFNKLLHAYTTYPWQAVLKSRFNHSYSNNEYICNFTKFDSLSAMKSYCPVCAKEDRIQLGYSYWRRILPEVKVCAKHNVVLLTACQFCDKPFAKGGHAASVMWSGCAGRHLGEAEPVVSVNPSAFRLAQFFDELCEADHHIYLDTAVAVLEERLIKKVAENPTDFLQNGALEKFQCYIENYRTNDVIHWWIYNSFSRELVSFATSLFETFDEFSAECRKLEPNTPSIDFFWDTYCCVGQGTEHFVKEYYYLGVAEWSWPAFEDLSCDPFLRTHSIMGYGTGGYHCCIPLDAHTSGDYPAHAPLPRVPRLSQEELLAMSQWPIPR